MHLRRILFILALIPIQFIGFSNKSNAVVIGALNITTLGEAGQKGGCASCCGQLFTGSALIGVGIWGITLFGPCGGGTFCCQACACCTYGCFSTTAKGNALCSPEENLQDEIFNAISKKVPVFNNLSDKAINDLRMHAIFLSSEGIDGNDGAAIIDDKLEIKLNRSLVLRLLENENLESEDEKNQILTTLCEYTNQQAVS